MITIEQINGEIAVLEDEKPTHVIMQKLAALYVVRDHIVISRPQADVVPDFDADSDFLKSVAGNSPREMWLVMDELMQAVSVTNPRLYESVMRKIKGQL